MPVTEVCGRTADIVDVALEIRFLGQKFCFLNMVVHHGCGSARYVLMEGQRTEAASAEASAVADQAEFYFRDRWNTTRCIVTRMPGSHV